MKKTYIFSHSNNFGTHEEIVEFIGECGFIHTWRRELPNTYFIVSEANANDIASKIMQHFSNNDGAAFLVAELNDNSQGLLHERSWSIINEQKLPPKATPKRTG